MPSSSKLDKKPHSQGHKKSKVRKSTAPANSISTAKKNELLQKENARLRKKCEAYEDKLSAKSKKNGSRHDYEQAAEKNPPLLIRKPAGEAGRSGNKKKAGFNLQNSMGLASKKSLYSKVRDFVRREAQAFDFGAETYKEQEHEKISAVCIRAKKKFPWLEQFHKTWPVHEILKGYQEGRAANNRLKQKAKKNAQDEQDSDEEVDEEDFDPRAALSLTKEESDGDSMSHESQEEIELMDVQMSVADNFGSEGASDEDQQVNVLDGILPDAPICRDKSAVFTDSEGYFYTAEGIFIHTTYDDTQDQYQRASDGRRLLLDAYPDRFDKWDDEKGFLDGIPRERSTFNHWKVGHFAPAPPTALSPRSRSHARSSSHVPLSSSKNTATTTASSSKHFHSQTPHAHSSSRVSISASKNAAAASSSKLFRAPTLHLSPLGVKSPNRFSDRFSPPPLSDLVSRKVPERTPPASRLINTQHTMSIFAPDSPLSAISSEHGGNTPIKLKKLRLGNAESSSKFAVNVVVKPPKAQPSRSKSFKADKGKGKAVTNTGRTTRSGNKRKADDDAEDTVKTKKCRKSDQTNVLD